MSRSWMALFVIAWLSCSVPIRCQVDPGTGGNGDAGPVAARPSKQARLALDAAKLLALACHGTHGEERARRIERAASAFDQVAADHATENGVVARASWCAAELWRRRGRLDLAEQRYLRSAELDRATYGQRALLGAADMQRRQHRLDRALATYRSCAAVDRGTTRAHHARLWQGRVLLLQGKTDAAIAQLQATLECVQSELAAIETVDHLAKAWIAKGDLESAGFCIDHAGDLVAEAADGDPVVAARLQRAFERMPSRKALQRARDKRSGAARDAVRLDEERRRQGAAKRQALRRQNG